MNFLSFLLTKAFAHSFIGFCYSSVVYISRVYDFLHHPNSSVIVKQNIKCPNIKQCIFTKVYYCYDICKALLREIDIFRNDTVSNNVCNLLDAA